MEDGSEFSAVPIRDNQLVAWPRVAAISAMVGFSILTFMTGLEVFKGLSPTNALWALFWGSVIVVIIGAITGYIGAADRMSSYLLVRVAFGDKGAALVNIAFAVSLMGWFGLNINLFMDTVGRLASDLWGLDIPNVLLAILASTCMTLTTLVGFKAINWLSTLLIPIMALVTILFARSAFTDQTWSGFLAMDKPARALGENAMSIGDGISWVVGAVIIGAIILPDITRFMRRPRGAVYTSILTYFIVGILVMSAAGLAAVSAGVFRPRGCHPHRCHFKAHARRESWHWGLYHHNCWDLGFEFSKSLLGRSRYKGDLPQSKHEMAHNHLGSRWCDCCPDEYLRSV